MLPVIISNKFSKTCKICTATVAVGVGVSVLDESGKRWDTLHCGCFPDGGEAAALQALEESLRNGDIILRCRQNRWSAMEVGKNKIDSGREPKIAHWFGDDYQQEAIRLQTAVTALETALRRRGASIRVFLVTDKIPDIPNAAQKARHRKGERRRFQKLAENFRALQGKFLSFHIWVRSGPEFRRAILDHSESPTTGA